MSGMEGIFEIVRSEAQGAFLTDGPDSVREAAQDWHNTRLAIQILTDEAELAAVESDATELAQEMYNGLVRDEETAQYCDYASRRIVEALEAGTPPGSVVLGAPRNWRES